MQRFISIYIPIVTLFNYYFGSGKGSLDNQTIYEYKVLDKSNYTNFGAFLKKEGFSRVGAFASTQVTKSNKADVGMNY